MENKIAYVIVCQPTELPEAYYLSGFSDAGDVLYSDVLAEACMYSLFESAKQIANELKHSRKVVDCEVRLNTLKY